MTATRFILIFDIFFVQILLPTVSGDAQATQFQFYIPPAVVLTPPTTIQPPEDINIKYWASWKTNTTIFDSTGLPWYCYTYRQTHCRPLYHLPANWRPSTSPGTTTVIKIKKRPKDGSLQSAAAAKTNEIEIDQQGKAPSKSEEVESEKTSPQASKKAGEEIVGAQDQLSGRDETIQVSANEVEQGSQEEEPQSVGHRRNDKFLNKTLNFEENFLEESDNLSSSGERGRGKGPLNEHPRSFDTDSAIVPTTPPSDVPQTTFPFVFFTTSTPQNMPELNETSSYSSVLIQSPKPKDKTTPSPTQFDSNENVTIVIGKVTPIGRYDEPNSTSKPNTKEAESNLTARPNIVSVTSSTPKEKSDTESKGSTARGFEGMTTKTFTTVRSSTSSSLTPTTESLTESSTSSQPESSTKKAIDSSKFESFTERAFESSTENPSENTTASLFEEIDDTFTIASTTLTQAPAVTDQDQASTLKVENVGVDSIVSSTQGNTGFQPRNSPSLFTPTWTIDPSQTLVPLPDAPPFIREPGRGIVVTGNTLFSSRPPWTQREFGFSTVLPEVSISSQRPTEASRFTPTQPSDDSELERSDQTVVNRTIDVSEISGNGTDVEQVQGRDRALDVGEINENSFVVPPISSSSLRPADQFEIERSEKNATETSATTTVVEVQNKTLSQEGPNEGQPNSTVTVRSDIEPSTDKSPTLGPRIGTSTEIYVNGTEVFPAYTVFGEPCKDECSKRGYSYTWCTKAVPSNVGTWSTTDYCTTESNVTPFGDNCADKCEKRGELYFWCHKVTTLWSFCTPEDLLERARSWKNTPKELPKAYTVHGEACKDDCRRRGYSYTWCTKANPSNLGSWRYTDYCTETSSVTSDGNTCIEECGFSGYSYSWCKTVTSWGYCTHKSFVDFLNRLRNETSLAAPTTLSTTTSTTTATSITDEEEEETTTELPLQGPIASGVISSQLIDDNVSLRIDSQVSEEPPLKVKINNEILEASKLNSESYPRHYNLAKGFTVYGESCLDECTFRDGYPYTWCNKVEASSEGTWSASDYCTNDHQITHMGEDCIDECEKRGQSYYWCHKLTALWGFCTPKFLLVHLQASLL